MFSFMEAADALKEIKTDDTCHACGGQLAFQDRQVICGICHAPADRRHPLQIRLDQEWEKRDKDDKQVAEANQRTNSQAGTEYNQALPHQAINDTLNVLSRQVGQMADQMKTMNQRLAKAESRLKKLEG